MKNLTIFILFFLAVFPCAAEIIIVDEEDPYDFNNIQDAVDHAHNPEDFIIIFPGTYTGPKNRDITVNHPVNIRSIDPEDTYFVAATIIDCNGTEFDQHRAFNINSTVYEELIIEGLTITNGFHDNGGAIYCGSNSNTKIRNCIITDNTARERDRAIYCYNSSTSTINNCDITSNTVLFGGSGGGIYSDQLSVITIEDCNLTQNIAKAGGSEDGGGAIFCGQQSSQIIRNCTINENTASCGGGIYCYRDSNSVIEDSIVIANSANDIDHSGSGPFQGGGIYCDEQTIVVIDNCIIAQNTAVGDNHDDNGGGVYCEQDSHVTITNSGINNNIARKGGGIYCYNDSNTTIINSTISGNQAKSLDPFDSGPFYGGGICGERNSTLRITKCLITGNTTVGDHDCCGGGVYCEGLKYLKITNCTIAGNAVTADNNPNAKGAGISWYGGTGPTQKITNCILWHNMFNGTVDQSSQIWPTFDPALSINYNCIEGLTGSIKGLGNIAADPCFAQPGYWSDPCGTPGDRNDDIWVDGDYHLQSQASCWDPNQQQWVIDANTSFCIDAGNPGSLLGDEPNEANNIRINMGAYGGTVQASKTPVGWSLLADLTNNGIVDFQDYAHQAKDWQMTDDEQPGDLNLNGTVEISDLSLLVEDWLEQTIWAEQP